MAKAPGNRVIEDGIQCVAGPSGGHHEQVLQPRLVVVDRVRIPPARQHGHGEDLLHGALEPQQCHHLPGRQLDAADAAGPLVLGQPLGDRDAAEDGALSRTCDNPG
jgi:hypothetical protein